jgi:endoglucanase
MLTHLSARVALWIILASSVAYGTVLSTSSRWIVNSSGNRVKLRCVNWAGAAETRIPEGLQWQPVATIASWVANQGFNCVRLTYSIDMALNPTQSVSASFQYAASSTGAGTALYPNLYNTAVTKNPWLSSATTLDAFKQVINALNNVGVMVILDNHVSHASWCCSTSDGNGWWASASGYSAANSQYFITDNWISGLEAMAKVAASYPNVVGMSLRNELRAVGGQDGNNHADWYSLVQEGASAIHSANSNLLVVIGGVNYAIDLSYLYSKPINFASLGLANKAVYEFHSYQWSNGDYGDCSAWDTLIGSQAGYLITQGKSYTGPLWLSEFGWTQVSTPTAESQYKSCLIAYMQANDADWAVWALQGSYYVRNGQVNSDESYGLLNTNWNGWRNSGWKSSVGSMFTLNQGPGA